jgi:diphosphomevalonate decarboxylase
MATVTRAHPNIALIKYWGKASGEGNVPATPSLSITLGALATTTTVSDAEVDRFELDEQPVADPKVARCLTNLRRRYAVPPLMIRSQNDFPTAAGLASSASGFAALITAIDAHCGLNLSAEERSDYARQASGSAARSIYGGFVALRGPHWHGQTLASAEDWPLQVVIAIATSEAKAVSSSDGMKRSAATSPYYPAWVTSTLDDFNAALPLVAARDFAGLADLAEFSCLKMHGLMLSSRPGLIYWNPTTLACIHLVRELRRSGLPVFFTVDAGPQVKAICLPEAAPAVADALADVHGVREVLISGLGEGAAVVTKRPLVTNVNND